jgi:hypothetical protein
MHGLGDTSGASFSTTCLPELWTRAGRRAPGDDTDDVKAALNKSPDGQQTRVVDRANNRTWITPTPSA